MKLYQYDHCPYCVRIKMMLGRKKFPYETITIPYDDIKTPTEIIGKKMLPILIKDDNYYDIDTISDGDISSNSIEALSVTDKLNQLNEKLDNFEPTGNINNINLDPPVVPRNVFAVGLNYKKHAEESNLEIPPFPMIFTKHSTCISGPKSDICKKTDMVDYEAELLIVIDKSGKDINKQDHINPQS